MTLGTPAPRAAKRKLIFAASYDAARAYARKLELHILDWEWLNYPIKVMGLFPREWEAVRLAGWRDNVDVAFSFRWLSEHSRWKAIMNEAIDV